MSRLDWMLLAVAFALLAYARFRLGAPIEGVVCVGFVVGALIGWRSQC